MPIGILNGGRGSNIKYLPYGFTENGVAMLSGVQRWCLTPLTAVTCKEEVVTNCDHLKSLRFSHVPVYAFTEQGVAMLAREAADLASTIRSSE
jgi:hypothetical protein